MQNALLVGLSRQVALAANSTWSPTTSPTSTPPATRPTARCSRNICPRPRTATRVRRSASCATAPPGIDMSRGPIEHTGNPLDVAIDGNGFFAVQTPRGVRYTRNGALPDQRHRPDRHQRRLSGARRHRPDHLAAQRSPDPGQPRRHHQRARGHVQRRLAARQAAPRQLRRPQAAAEGRRQHLQLRRRRRSRRPTPSRAWFRARSRNPT